MCTYECDLVLTRTLRLNIICMQPSTSLNIYTPHLTIFKSRLGVECSDLVSTYEPIMMFKAFGGGVCACLPVHDESVGDDHLLQVVLIMFRDAEKIQIVALLIIWYLQQSEEAWC